MILHSDYNLGTQNLSFLQTQLLSELNESGVVSLFPLQQAALIEGLYLLPLPLKESVKTAAASPLPLLTGKKGKGEK